jgi:hypothetical protein
MDQQDLDDWRDFCENTKQFEEDHFSRMFMDLFSDPSRSRRDRDDLRTVFGYVPNSSRTLEEMLSLDVRADDKKDQEITDLVIRDLKEMRRILDEPEILAAIDLGVSEIVHDETRFQEARDSALNWTYGYAISAHFIDEMRRHPHGKEISALHEAFYGIASNVHLQTALTASLANSEINGDHYFELYRIGVDYALDTTGAVVINYREIMGP